MVRKFLNRNLKYIFIFLILISGAVHLQLSHMNFYILREHENILRSYFIEHLGEDIKIDITRINHLAVGTHTFGGIVENPETQFTFELTFENRNPIRFTNFAIVSDRIPRCGWFVHFIDGSEMRCWEFRRDFVEGDGNWDELP